MRSRVFSFIIFLAVSSITVGEVQAATPGPPPFASNYQLVFNQDFTTMTSLSQLGVSATNMGTGIWTSHTPTNQDYFTFENPSANYKPFGVGNGYLDIRVQQDGNDPNNWFDGFSGGLLSSMDSSGKGFAQQYGYFECSMQTPGTPNTWPAFWLLSAPNLTEPWLSHLAEIDVMENYGNYQTGPNQTPAGNSDAYSVAWHNWGWSGNPTQQAGKFTQESGLSTGYHTYGVDIEPSGITWYFDRQPVWQAPIFPAAQQPMLAMVNLALGGGNYNNSTGTGYNWALTPNPSDLKVLYVAVWASPYSPNYVPSGVPAAPSGVTATGGNAQVSLTWNAVTGATSYQVLRSTSAGSETVLNADVTEASYTDSTVSGTQTYYYQIRAVNSLGVSGASSEVSAKATGGPVSVSIPGPPPFGPNYQLVFGQDFTNMTDISQLGVSATVMGKGTWIAHTPTNEDFFTFENPTANYQPFGVGNGYLAIRVQQDGNDPHNWFSGFSGGLISSFDGYGSGFAQQYGYFECSMWTPGSPNTWPAFWLLSAPNMTNPNLPYLAEIDVMESYGNYQSGANQMPPGNPDAYSVAWHNWGITANTQTAQSGSFLQESGLTTGYHTYGVDVEPSGITWYFDRQPVYQAAIFPAAQQPLLMMVDLALGGGQYNNANATGYNWLLTPDPTDLKVQYVAVWASPSSPNYSNNGSPAAPQGLSAAAGNAQVALTWTASAGATSYNILRGTTTGGETALSSGITGTTYNDTAVTNGSTYYYEVVAVNGSGSSGVSNEATALPTGTVPVPAAPTGLSATAGNTQVVLAWTASSGATSYNISRSTSPGSETLMTSGMVSTSYKDTSVVNGTTYYYKVAAVNTSGTSAGSNEASASPSSGSAPIPAAPTGLSATAGNAKVTLTWTASAGATSYNVLRGTSSGSEISITSGITSTSYTDSTVVNGTTYYYQVVAVNGSGSSGDSNEAVASPTTGVVAPTAPTGLSATAGNLQNVLAWSASSGATSYNILRGTSAGSETLLTSGISSTTYTDSTVVNGTTYYYEVAAVNSAGTSGNSNEASATPTVGGGALPSPWLNTDIGPVGTKGSSTYSGGTFTLSGAGSGPYYVPDALQFAYQIVTGDSTIIARVATQANSSQYAHAGVIIRDSLATNAGFADMNMYPNGGGALFQYRGDTGFANTIWGKGTAPYWLKLTRSGNTFTGYVSPDGITWTTVGTTTVNMSATAYIGLFQASATNTAASATFDNVSVTSASGASTAPSTPTNLAATAGNAAVTLKWSASTGATSYKILRGTSTGSETTLTTGVATTSYTDSAVTNGTIYYYEVEAVNAAGSSGASNEVNATPSAGNGALPSPWMNQDVGATWAPGSSTYAGSTFTLNGAGSGPYYAPDGFQFAYQAVTGDCTIIARVATQDNSNTYAHAGVIIRDALSANAGFADANFYPNGGGALFQYRPDGGSPNTMFGTGTAPYWLKLTRSGNTFTGFASPDGVTWTLLGSTTISMPATVYVGLFQASGTGAVATATFDNVSVTGASSAGAAALPSPWLSQDIGATFAPGSSTYAGGTFTLSGAGSGPYYAPDGFQFAYQTVTGDCTIVARVATQANSSQYAHAGVIIRDGLTANAGFADANFYPNGGGALFQYRADGGWASTKYGSGTAPYWVKLTRAGNTFTGFVSPDGTTWTTLGSTTITMPATVYVGLFQASGTGTLATSTFDNVSVTN